MNHEYYERTIKEVNNKENIMFFPNPKYLNFN